MIRPTYSRAINRPRLVFGTEKWTFVSAICIVLVSMFFWRQHFGILVSTALSLGTGWLICRASAIYTKRDPKFFSGRIRAFFHAASYDPGKFQPFRVEIKK